MIDPGENADQPSSFRAIWDHFGHFWPATTVLNQVLWASKSFCGHQKIICGSFFGHQKENCGSFVDTKIYFVLHLWTPKKKVAVLTRFLRITLNECLIRC